MRTLYSRIEKWLRLNRLRLFFILLIIVVYLTLEQIISDKFIDFIVTGIFNDTPPSLLYQILFSLLVLAGILLVNRRKFKITDVLPLTWFLYLRLGCNRDEQFWTLFVEPFAFPDLTLLYYIPEITLFRDKIISFFDELLEGHTNVAKKPDEENNDLLFRDFPVAKNKAENDTLKRIPYAKHIAEVISAIDKDSTHAIGICGPWGTGKTSLLNLITTELENNKNFSVIEFSPWFYDSFESLVVELFKLFEKQFETNQDIITQLRKYEKEIVTISKSLLKTDLLELLGEKSEKDISARLTHLKELILKEEKRVVVVIDDLDRLHCKEVIEIFRLIRLIANFPNTHYLVAYDKSYITAAINKELTGHKPERYLDKIFSVEFVIPELSVDTVFERLKSYLLQGTEILSRRGINFERQEIERCFKERKFIEKILVNERDIKRFCNNLFIRLLPVGTEVNFFHFFLLELITYYGSSNFTWIYTAHKELIKNKNINKSNKLDLLITYSLPKDAAILESHIVELFCEENQNDRFAISNSTYFYRYFLLTHIDTDFSQREFEEVFNGTKQEIALNLKLLYARNRTILHQKLTSRYSSHFSGNGIDELSALVSLYQSIGKTTFNAGLSQPLIIELIALMVQRKHIKNNDLFAEIENEEIDKQVVWSEVVFNRTVFHPYYEQNRERILASQEQLISRLVAEDQFHLLLQFFKSFLAGNVNILSGGSSQVVNSKWFISKILTPCINFLKGKFKHLSASEVNKLFNSETSDHTPYKAVSEVFFDPTIAEFYNDDFLQLRNYIWIHRMQRNPHFSFTNQPPPLKEYPQHNDSFFPAVHTNTGFEFHINITPVQTAFWRFGFRFSKQSTFEKITYRRHTSQHPVIHLGKYSQSNDITLTIYGGENVLKKMVVLTNYHDTLITIKVFIKSSSYVMQINGIDVINEQTIKEIGMNHFIDYRYVELFAWADEKPYKIDSEITFYNPA